MLRNEGAGRRKRVVIVDDSKTMQAVLEQIFSLRLGWDVVGMADDAASAASLIRSIRPDLVTIDLCMPYVDGSRLLQMLEDVPEACKIIVSGQVRDHPEMAAKLRQAGADYILDKRDLSRDPVAFFSAITKVMAGFGRGKPSRALPAVPRVADRSPGVFGHPIPIDEQERLDALLDSGLLNDRLDARLDLLTAHVSTVTGFPTCMMTFIDRERQWIKSAYGFARGSMPRAVAFCNYTLCADEAFAVSNAETDARFAENPLVVGDPGIRSYVGSPIVSSAGVRLGALCLIDMKPRRITPGVIASLRSAASIATALIESPPPGVPLSRAA